IDLFLIPALDVPRVTAVELLPHGVSDHAPLLLRLDDADAGRRPVWRLNA
ncbi:hypothetical protein NDU88_005216, partial [Pleurodeles waltl]